MARSEITAKQVRDEDFYLQSEGDTLSGTLSARIDAKPDTLLELDDTPSVYEAGKVLQSTTSGAEWSTVSGAGGTSFHSELYELDYASSGHTGFSPEVHDHEFIDLTDTPTTYSGYRGYYARVTESGTLALEFDDLTDKIAAYGGGVILYPNATDSDISGYKNIRAYPVDESEVFDSVTTSTKGIIQEFVTSSGIDAIIIPAGKWVFNIYASTSSSSQINTVEVEVYLRDVVGTETLMFSEETSPLLYGVATLYRILVIIPNDTSLADNERLVFKFYGVNYQGGAKTIKLYYQGNTSYTHIDTPLSSVFLTEHTKLIGLDDYDDHPQYLNIDRGDGRYYTETEVDTISGTLQDYIDAKPDTLLELDDTPDYYDEGKYLISTTSGVEWTTISGATVSGFEYMLREVMDGYYEELNVEASTTSTSYIQRLRLTMVPAYSDYYLINFSTMVSHEDTGVFMKLRLQINDVTTYKESWLELYNYKYYDGAYQIWSGSFAVLFTAGLTYNIDLDYATGDSGKAMYIKESSLAAQRLMTV